MPAKKRTTLKIDPASSEWIGLRLIVLSNRYMNSLYSEIGRVHDLQRTEIAVIACLSLTDARTADGIVRYTGRPKNSVSRAVMKLEEAGLLKRSAHPKDGRSADLALTAQGRHVFKLLKRRFADHDAQLIANLNEHERREFTRLLSLISDPPMNWERAQSSPRRSA